MSAASRIPAGVLRLSDGLRAARALPNAKVVFTGGLGIPPWRGRRRPVNQVISDRCRDRTSIVIENASKDTYENAVFTREILKPKPGDRWLLITAAYHMPRAVGVFRQ